MLTSLVTEGQSNTQVCGKVFFEVSQNLFGSETLGYGKGTGKCKVAPVLLTEHDDMKAYWGSRGIAPRIL
jgi:hypothetical protein